MLTCNAVKFSQLTKMLNKLYDKSITQCRQVSHGRFYIPTPLLMNISVIWWMTPYRYFEKKCRLNLYSRSVKDIDIRGGSSLHSQRVRRASLKSHHKRFFWGKELRYIERGVTVIWWAWDVCLSYQGYKTTSSSSQSHSSHSPWFVVNFVENAFTHKCTKSLSCITSQFAVSFRLYSCLFADSLGSDLFLGLNFESCLHLHPSLYSGWHVRDVFDSCGWSGNETGSTFVGWPIFAKLYLILVGQIIINFSMGTKRPHIIAGKADMPQLWSETGKFVNAKSKCENNF